MDQMASLLIPLVLIGGMFIFMQRGESKKKKQYEEMLDAVQLNDEVTTKSGIIGKVIKLEDDEMIIQSGSEKSVRLKMLKSSILYITRSEDGIATTEKE